MSAFIIGALIGGNVVLWSELASRKPSREGIFEERPMLGVAIVCFGAVVAMWIRGNFA